MINASFNYAPFGEVVEATNVGGPLGGLPFHRRRMNDKFVDEISDLAYYGFRYYDKTSMTWTQSDPLYRFAPDAAWVAPRKGSLYTMSLNNPLRYIDPDGRFALALPLIELLVEGLVAAAPYLIPAATGAAAGYGLAVAPASPTMIRDDQCPSCVYERTMEAVSDGRIRDQTLEAGDTAAAKGVSAETPNTNGMMAESKPDAASSGPKPGGGPVAGTGKKAGRAFTATVKPGVPGPPKKTGTKPVKKSDAGKIAGRQGKFGGVIGSKTQAEKMDGRQDAGHQGGPPHTHTDETPQQGSGHFWIQPKPPS